MTLPKISETLWYVATFDDQCVALLSFSAAALNGFCQTVIIQCTSTVSDQKVKPTNEIKTVIPLLDGIDIQGKEFTAGALLTQRKYQQGLSRSVSRLTRVIWT